MGTEAGKDGLPILAFGSDEDFEQWLDVEHATAPGLWLKIAKKAAGIPTVSYAEAVLTALCYGWIDGQKASYDERYFLQRFTPRRSRSKWSKINRDHVERLVAAGRMRPAGMAQVELAKADGRWDDAYDSQRTATVPDDLAEALRARPQAQVAFDRLNSVNRYAILFRIHDAKRPQTRARRIASFVDMLERRETLH